jgi:hypothetical protein
MKIKGKRRFSRPKYGGLLQEKLDDFMNYFVTIEETCTVKKKIKFSSYIRKFRMEQLQSHMVKYLRIFSYIRKPFLIV